MPDEDEAALLHELRSISNRHTAERYVSKASSSSSSSSVASSFLQETPESPELNQYWYSQTTIDALRDAILEGAASLDKGAPRVAFLSTPSLYFAFDEAERHNFHLLDLDDKATWSKDVNYAYYDYNVPLGFDVSLRSSFDMVVIDPPFITREVWEKYAQTAAALAAPSSAPKQPLIIATTVWENAPLMKELFGAAPTTFQPAIPNLVYQYACFANFPCDRLTRPNGEITL